MKTMSEDTTGLLRTHKDHMQSVQDAVTAFFNGGITTGARSSELSTQHKKEIDRNIVTSNRAYAILCPKHQELTGASKSQRKRILRETRKTVKQSYTGSLSIWASIWFWYQWGSRILAVVDFVFDLMTEPETLAKIKELYKAPSALYVSCTEDFANPVWQSCEVSDRLDDPQEPN